MVYSNSEIIAVINEWIHSERDRAIMIDRFVNGYTYEKLAEIHDLSVRQVKRIIYKCSDAISPHITI